MPTKEIILNTHGQSLLELIIALGIIVTGVIATLTLTTSNITSTSESWGRLIAGNLGREGLEVVRNIRDSNWLAGRAWDSGLSFGSDIGATANFDLATKTWSLDFTPNTLGEAGTRLYLHADDVYNHESLGGEETLFYRLITIDPVGTDYLKKVTARVQWSERARVHNLNFETWLYNWR